MTHRGCNGYGVEIDDSKVLACIERGVNVLQLNLEDGLSMFEDQASMWCCRSTPCSICAMPGFMLLETARVIGVVCLPNFADCIRPTAW